MVIGIAVGQEPSGAGEKILGFGGVQGGPGGLADGGEPGVETGAGGLVVVSGQRHADRKPTARARDLVELAQDGLEDRPLQVDSDPFKQEQGRLAGIESRVPQQVRDRGVKGEVGRDEPHLPGGEAEALQSLPLVLLGRGMVHLEPADAGLGVPEGAAVVACRADDDLVHAAAQGADHGLVEEPGPRGEVVLYPAFRAVLPAGDVDGQGLVGGGIAVGGGNPGEPEPVRRHPLGGYRGAAPFHVSATVPFASSPGHSATAAWAGRRPCGSVNGMATESDHRSVRLERIENSRYTATNVRGGQIDIGTGAGADFTPVELLLVAIGGCTAVDVDLLTSRRAEPDSFEIVIDAEKVRDEAGNHLTDLAVTFRVRFPDGEAGDRARALLPDAAKQSHDRLCTVSRTVEIGTPIAIRIE